LLDNFFQVSVALSVAAANAVNMMKLRRLDLISLAWWNCIVRLPRSWDAIIGSRRGI